MKDGEISSVRDLLNPKWRGKVITSDQRIGSGLFSVASVAKTYSNDVVKTLLVGQQPKVGGGSNLLIERSRTAPTPSPRASV